MAIDWNVFAEPGDVEARWAKSEGARIFFGDDFAIGKADGSCARVVLRDERILFSILQKWLERVEEGGVVALVLTDLVGFTPVLASTEHFALEHVPGAGSGLDFGRLDRVLALDRALGVVLVIFLFGNGRHGYRFITHGILQERGEKNGRRTSYIIGIVNPFTLKKWPDLRRGRAGCRGLCWRRRTTCPDATSELIQECVYTKERCSKARFVGGKDEIFDHIERSELTEERW